jgi:hypothetical protein
MLSIEGIFDGKQVRFLEKITNKKKYKVVVTFLEEIKSDEGYLRNFTAQTKGIEFWENKDEDIYQDYLKPKKK